MKYLEACMFRHALSFFQWRAKYCPSNRKQVIKGIIDNRKSILVDFNKTIEKKLQQSEMMHK